MAFIFLSQENWMFSFFIFSEKTPSLFPGNLPLDFWCVYLAVDASVAPNTRQVVSVFGTPGLRGQASAVFLKLGVTGYASSPK